MQMSQHIVTDDGSNGIVKPNQLSPDKDVERLKLCYVLNTIHIATNKGVVSNTKYSRRRLHQFVTESSKITYKSPFVMVSLISSSF